MKEEDIPDETYEALREKDEKRRKYARLFALVCFVGLLIYGGRAFDRLYSYTVQIHYVYKDVPDAATLKLVESRLYPPKEKKAHAKANYYHYGSITNKLVKRQKLKLPKGVYQLRVVLHYKNKPSRVIKRTLQVRSSGTHYILLRKAKAP